MNIIRKTVSILLYDDVEVIDFAGPFEVFTLANEHEEYRLFDVKIVARDKNAVTTHNGLSVNPAFSIQEITKTDILIVPGGDDLSAVLDDEATIRWVQKSAESAEQVLSVCSGSLILAKAGLLNGLKATTHRVDFDQLIALAPECEVVREVKFVDNGKVVTSAGITTGIDMSLHVIEKLYGAELANKTRTSLEYTPG